MVDQHYMFRVQGSAPDPYTIDITVSGDNMTAICTCPAGGFGKVCKHRVGLLYGEVSELVSGNESDVTALRDVLEGTDVQVRLSRLQDSEDDLAAAKLRVTAAKKALAAAFRD